MNRVTIGVSDIEALKQRTEAAFRGEPQGERISFASVELLWKALTPRRWGVDPGDGWAGADEFARRRKAGWA